MKINIAKSSGFCFGVKRAIEMCLELAKTKEHVYILGDIVHNNSVVRQLAESGIKKIEHIKSVGRPATIIIRAHGAPKKTFDKAARCGFSIVDATCPMVKDIYKIGRKLERTNKIIIIGDHNHDEVKGIAGQLRKEPIILASPGEVSAKKLAGIEKAAVITQSTQSIENISAIMKELLKILPDVRLYNTTCRTTVIKQEEIKTLPLDNNIILIVGSPSSANTKRLYQISHAINKKTRWIESVDDLRPTWFKDVDSVGIMAGASTPDFIIKDIVKKLKEIDKKT